MSDLNFDHHQFEGDAYPVSAKTCITFEDYRSMQTATRCAAPVAFVPPFALNDKQLQRVLLKRAWGYIYGGLPMPEAINREELNEAATAKATRGYAICKTASPIQQEQADRHMAAVSRAGGFLQLHASIAFRSWRLGMDSVSVAATLAMTPAAVRQALWRMRAVAKKLGYEVGRAGYTAGTTRPRGTSAKILRLNAEVLEQYKSGTPISEIAINVFGYAPDSHYGAPRVRKILKAAGAFVPKPKRQKRKARMNAAIISASVREQIVAQYAAGTRTPQIAAQTGCRNDQVRRVLKQAGVYQGRMWYKVGPKETAQIIAAYLDGGSLKKIAKQIGCGRRLVRRTIRKVAPSKNRAQQARLLQDWLTAFNSSEPAPHPTA
ncbi:MAG TPA: hypothetical protein VGK22_03805 [Candidatus Angelobacter sp.]|jgi:hypothetical protein